MTPTRVKIHALALVLTITSIAAPARDEPRQGELESAARALALAAEAGASTYAPLELRYAGEQLDEARQAEAAGEPQDARRLLERSRVNSDLALAKSRLGKTREAVQLKAADNVRLRQQFGLPAAEPLQ